MAHQWFGDLVTMQWWDDIWLNEGFATWMASKPLKALKPEWHVDLDEVQANQKAMTLDALRSTRSIRSKASTPAQILELFDAIAYEKGGAVLRMIEAWVGEEEFRTGVNAYIERFKYGNARAEDFWGTLAKSTGKPVDRVMKDFVDQPGVPLVDAAVRCAAGRGTATIAQDRPRRGAPATPVVEHTGLRQDTRRQGHVRGRGLNAGCGSSRLVSPVGRWRMRAPAATTGRSTPRDAAPCAKDINALAPAERIGLLADEWAHVRAGRHDVGAFLDLAAGFKGERTAAVVSTLPAALEQHRRGADDGRIAGGVSRMAVGTAAAGAPGGRVVASGSRHRRDTGAARDAGCDARRAPRATRRRSQKPASSSSPELAKAGHGRAHAARRRRDGRGESGRRVVVRPVPRAQQGGDRSGRPLSIPVRADVVQRSRPRPPDHGLHPGSGGPQPGRGGAHRRAASNRERRRSPGSCCRQRWDDLQKKTGGFAGNGYIVASLGSFCDTGTLAEVKQFFAARKVPEAERTLQQATERISACAALAAQQSGKLGAWLGSR